MAKIVDFEEVNVRLGENQPEYQTLPAFYNDKDGSYAYCFEFSEEELAEIQKTGRIWFKSLAFGGRLQPVLPSVSKEEILKPIQL